MKQNNQRKGLADFNKLRETLKSASLNSEEKTNIRENIVTFINSKRLAPISLSLSGPKKRNLLDLSGVFRLKYLPVFLGAIFVSMAGLSLAAESALPGESLYVVKGINENLKLLLVPDEGSKSKLELEYISRNLEEAAVLLASGRLDEVNKGQVENRINKHVSGLIGKGGISWRRAVDLSDLEAILGAHGEVLDSIAALTQPIIGSDLASSVKLKTKLVKDSRIAFENNFEKIGDADSKSLANQELTRATNLLLSVGSAAQIQSNSLNNSASIEKATELVAEARGKINQGEFESAYKTLQSAGRIAKTVEILTNAKVAFDVDVKVLEETIVDDKLNKNSHKPINSNKEKTLNRFEGANSINLSA